METAGRSGGGAFSRHLTLLTAVLFGAVGLVLFLAPDDAADSFAWRISAFQAMTMGGWLLGSAAMAALAWRSWRFAECYAALVYVWAFGLFEGLALLVHAEDLHVDSALAAGYVASIALAAVAGLVGVADWARRRPSRDASEPANPPLSRLLSAGFVLYVGGISVLLADGIEPDGSIWPGPLSLLSARSFAAFFLALVVAEAVQVFERSFPPVRLFLAGGLALVVPITAAALVYLDRFDYGEHPLGALYLASYVAACLGAVGLLTLVGRRSGDAADEPAAPAAVRGERV